MIKTRELMELKMTNGEYSKYVDKKTPNSPMWKNLVKAFVVGGLICCVGQAIKSGYTALELGEDLASTAASVTLVLLGVALTAFGVYDRIAKFAGAGTLVPITGFANSVAAPAMEFKTEGFITGLAAKMFIISGPVIVYGTVASVIYGLALVLFGLV